MITKEGTMSFKDKCMAANVNYPNALYQRKQHKSLTDEEVIEICCKKKVMDLSEEDKAKYFRDKEKPFLIKCREKNRDYAKAYMFLHRHEDMTEDEVITYYVLKRQFKQITKEITKGFIELKQTYPELSDEELVAYCKVTTIHPTFTKEDIKRYFELKGMYPQKSDSEIFALMT